MSETQRRDLGWRNKSGSQGKMKLPKECSKKREPRTEPWEMQGFQRLQVRSRGEGRGGEMGGMPREVGSWKPKEESALKRGGVNPIKCS